MARTGLSTTRELEDLFIHILRKCNKTEFLKRIHAQMEKLSLLQSNFLVTRMLDVCDQNRETEYANLLFQNVLEPNIFLCNAMIRAYTHNRMYASAIETYKEALRRQDRISPDRFTYPFVIRSCAGLGRVCLGKQVQGHVCKSGLLSVDLVGSSLVDMYVKCDEVTDAHKVFDEMSERDVVSWNGLISGYMKLGQPRKARSLFDEMPNRTIVSWTAMISGYAKIGRFGDSLSMFRAMQVDGMDPDWVSLVSILPVCAELGSLELGKWIHFYADKKGLLRKKPVSNALIEMYTKCGSISQALQVFDSMPDRDVVSWSTMISGLAHHGRAHEAIDLFREMQISGVNPNEITFVGVLSACSHAGLLDEGLKYFELMKNVYDIEPGIEHYGCVVDLLGRTGKIDRALKVVKSMRIEADSAIWGSLLSSCRTYRNIETAVVVMDKLLELEPEDTGNLVLFANIYADLGMWDEVSRMRKLIRSRNMKKMPGCSLIEVDSVVQEFTSGDDTKPFFEEIFDILRILVMHQVETDDRDDVELEQV